jgi:ComF family protein
VRAIKALLDLLMPPRCGGCGHEGRLLCEPCAELLLRRMDEPAGAPLGLPVAMPQGLLQLEWCATYSGHPRAALHAFKYSGEQRLADPLADALAVRWSRAGVGGDLLTWVPVHPSRRRDRGYDQAELLARAMARRLGLPVAGCLERQQRTAAQHALGRRDRVGNIRGAFVVPAHQRPRMAGRWVVVVDDILTTGSTLAACATALHGAGVIGVSAITVARDR